MVDKPIFGIGFFHFYFKFLRIEIFEITNPEIQILAFTRRKNLKLGKEQDMRKVYLLAILIVSIALVFSVSYAQMEMKGEYHQGKTCDMEVEKKCSKMGSETKCVKMISGCGEMDSDIMHECKMMCGKMGSGCCEMGSGMMHGGKMMGEGMDCCKKNFFLCCKDKFELTDDQVTSLKKIKLSFAKEDIQRDADLKIAELELKELMGADKIDMAKVEKMIKSIASMKAEKKISHLKTFEQAKQVLTQEQLGKMKK